MWLWWLDSRWLDGGRNDAASVGCALLLICWMIELAARAFWKLAEGFEQFPWRGYGSWRERSRWNFAKCFEFGSYSVLTLLRHGWRSLVALWYTPSTASLVENLPSVYSCALWGIAMACFTIVRMRCCRSPKSHRMRRGTTSSHQAPFWRTKQVFFLSIRVCDNSRNFGLFTASIFRTACSASRETMWKLAWRSIICYMLSTEWIERASNE